MTNPEPIAAVIARTESMLDRGICHVDDVRLIIAEWRRLTEPGKSGNPRLEEARVAGVATNRKAAQEYREKIAARVELARREGAKSWREVSDKLNDSGITTRRGGKWNPQTLSVAMMRHAGDSNG